MSYNYEKMLNEYMYADGKLTTVEQGDRFLKWVLLQLFNRTEEELGDTNGREGVVLPDGSGDRGIDAFFVDGTVLYIIQSKFRKTHSYNEVYNFKVQMEEFFSNEDARKLTKESLIELFNLIYSDDVSQIKIYYVTNNDISFEIDAHKYDEISEDMENNFTNKLEKEVQFNVCGLNEFSKIRTGILLKLPGEIQNSTADVTLPNWFQNRDSNSIVGELPLKDLASIVDKNKDYIFFSNIRNYKGMNKINSEMYRTFQEHPKNFWFYNNGITIVCKDYSVSSTNKDTPIRVTITAPQIVNGCQTASTIHKAWKQMLPKDRNTIDGTILVKIIKDPREEKRKDITKYTNSQTAVSGKDFFALEDFHKQLQGNFDKLGYYYEIQSNSSKYIKPKSGNEKYAHLFDKKFKNTLIAKEATQMYVTCMLNMPAKAKNIGQFMPGGDKYEVAYKQETPLDPRYYLLPYGVYYYLKNVCDSSNYRIDKDKWAASLLLASNLVFKTIAKIYFDDEVKYISDEFINKCDECITDKSEFLKIIDVAAYALADFYKDSMVRNTIGDNLPKFLKSTVESNKSIVEILDSKLTDSVEENYNQNI